MTKSGARQFAQAIDDDYRVHWIVDNLPASTLLTNKVDPARPFHVRGFPVGFRQEEPGAKAQHFLFNHVKIIVSVHREEVAPAADAADADAAAAAEERVRVVGFRIEPYSIAHAYDAAQPFSTQSTELTTCSAARPAANDPTNYQRIDGAGEVVFTYDVEWEDSATPWANRWDVFLQGNPDDKIHWFSITNSTMIVVFLTARPRRARERRRAGGEARGAGHGGHVHVSSGEGGCGNGAQKAGDRKCFQSRFHFYSPVLSVLPKTTPHNGYGSSA